MRKILLVILFFISIMFIGCDRREVEEKEDMESEKSPIISEESEKEDVIEEKLGIPSPLSGIYASEEKVLRRPVAVMFDNHPSARWQGGLSQAEIVYEFMVEAPYTRYMGIFLINDPKEIGPIRSSRPYFVTTLLEYDPVYVRVGGSAQAKKDILELKIADIDGLTSSPSVFYRKSNKKIPHNLYTTMESIRNTQIERGYKLIGDFIGFKFFDDDTVIDGFNAKEIDILYNAENETKYVYDENKKVYIRYKDNKKQYDEYDNAPIEAKNIIIQEANTKVIDKEGRLSIDLIGTGKGIYITNGKGKNITWRKDSRSGKTLFLDEGVEITLNQGITWVQVTKINPNIIIK